MNNISKVQVSISRRPESPEHSNHEARRLAISHGLKAPAVHVCQPPSIPHSHALPGAIKMHGHLEALETFIDSEAAGIDRRGGGGGRTFAVLLEVAHRGPKPGSRLRPEKQKDLVRLQVPEA